MEFHPFADTFPLMEERKLAALAENISEHGQRVEIVVYQGKILDGRNRFLACERAGVVPKFCDGRFPDDDVARAFVESANAHRRHQDKVALEKSVLRLRAMGKSTTQIAEKVGVSEPTVRRTIERSTSSGGEVEQPAAITGKDGKRRPPKKAKPTEVKERKARTKKKKAAGKSVREIAKEEGVSVGTVARDLSESSSPNVDPDPWPGSYIIAARLESLLAKAVALCAEHSTSAHEELSSALDGVLKPLGDAHRLAAGFMNKAHRRTK